MKNLLETCVAFAITINKHRHKMQMEQWCAELTCLVQLLYLFTYLEVAALVLNFRLLHNHHSAVSMVGTVVTYTP